MATANESNLSRTFTGSFLEFYQQHDNTIRIRVYLTPNAADFEIIVSAAHWTTIKTLASAGDVQRTSEALGPMGADNTVDVSV